MKFSPWQRLSMKWLNNHAFSLIETIVTLALVCILATLTLANISFLNRSLIRSEIDKLYTACMYLQRRAQVTNTIQKLSFDCENNTYTVGNQEHQLPSGLMFGSMPGAKGPPSAPRVLIKKPSTFGRSMIEFYPDGIIKSGTIYLVDAKKQVMYALSSAVSQVSFLRKYQYDGRWKLLD